MVCPPKVQLNENAEVIAKRRAVRQLEPAGHTPRKHEIAAVFGADRAGGLMVKQNEVAAGPTVQQE